MYLQMHSVVYLSDSKYGLHNFLKFSRRKLVKQVRMSICAVTLLVWRQEQHPVCKNSSDEVLASHGYVSRAPGPAWSNFVD